MKLIRVEKNGQEKPAVLTDDNRRLDVSAHFNDFDGEFFADNGLI